MVSGEIVDRDGDFPSLVVEKIICLRDFLYKTNLNFPSWQRLRRLRRRHRWLNLNLAIFQTYC